MAAVNDGSVEMEGSGLVFLSTVKLPLFYMFCALSAFVIVLDIVCLIFFIVFRNRRIVRLTSPKLNYIIVIAVLFLCLAGILYPFPTTDSGTLKVLCPIRSVSHSLMGFDLCFSVLLVKLCRIYYIFHKPETSKKIPMEIAFADIGPKQNAEEPYVLNEMGKEVENFFLTCSDSVIFLVRTVLTVFYKIVVQGVTLVLAIMLRKVKIPSLDDARYVTVMTYIAVELSLIVIVTTFILGEYANTYAAIYATSSIMVGGCFLSLLFVPKMVILYRDPQGRKIFESTGVRSCRRIRGSSSTPATSIGQGLELSESFTSPIVPHTSGSSTIDVV